MNDAAVDEVPNNADTIAKDNVAQEAAAEPQQSEVAVDAGWFCEKIVYKYATIIFNA